MSKRRPLTRERVLQTALKMADRAGLDGLSMRALGQALGVEAMSLYNHVANKDDLLDGLVDLVFAEFEVPLDAPLWQEAMLARARSIRAVLAKHPWALGLLESRANPGPGTLTHHDAMIGVLRRAGFTVAGTAHALAALDAYIYGFVLTEQRLPFDTGPGAAELAERMLPALAGSPYPHFVEFVTEHVLQPGYDYGDEFLFGLQLLLDGLERLRLRALAPGRAE